MAKVFLGSGVGALEADKDGDYLTSDEVCVETNRKLRAKLKVKKHCSVKVCLPTCISACLCLFVLCAL